MRTPMRTLSSRFLAAALLLALLAPAVGRAEPFRQKVGDVPVNPVADAKPLPVPFLTWGGDVPGFYANGGLTTAKGSIYDNLGLDLKFTNGDDFVAQVRNYLKGETPFLRGTMGMIALASDTLGADPRTKPVVFLQLTWSAGDHMVSRGTLKTLNDLKGKTIALQDGGPHVGMLDDILRAAQLSYDDVKIVFTPDLTGPNGPAAKFRADPSVDACLVISPDMIGLTGGLDSAGSGAEGTVKDAKVLVSTAQMSRSIADVWACRKDYFDAHRDTVEKFAAGYLDGVNHVIDLRKRYDAGDTAGYKAVLQMAQDVFGKEVLPTLEVDAYGLIADATFVGLPGNVSFFTDRGNLEGFDAKQKQRLDLATSRGYAAVRAGFFGPDFDYAKLAKLANVTYDPAAVAKAGRFNAESVAAFPDSGLDDRTLLSFTINFDPNQTDFSADVYGPEFKRALQTAATFGNAVVAVRGHADPTKTLIDLLKAGTAKGVIRRTGESGNYAYFYNGQPLDLNATDKVVALIQQGAFDGGAEAGGANPRETMQAALNLSRARAESVRDAVVKFAKANGYTFDPTQIQPVGVGVREPLVPKPSNIQEAKKNMRVEFRLIKVPAEAVKSSDFDF